MLAEREARALLTAFLLTLPLVNPLLRSEGVGYYAWLRSAVVEGDLQFEDEYRRADPDFLRAQFRHSDGHLRPLFDTRTGHARNEWAVGPALLWAPSFLQAHVLVLGLRGLGAPLEADGYAWPYLWLCAAATAVYGFLGLLLAYATARRFVEAPSAALATAAIWTASSLPLYMYGLPFHGHALAAFAVSLFLWYGVRTREERGGAQWAVWGGLGGLMAVVYHANACLLAVAAAELLRTLRVRGPVRALGAGVLFAAAGLLAGLPHFLGKWIVHGSPFDTGRINRFFWETPHLLEVAFSPEHGFLLWTPVLLPAVLGLALVLRRDRWLGVGLLAAFAAFHYGVASFENWHGTSSFGSRYFVSFTAPFVLGLALVLEAWRRRAPRAWPWAAPAAAALLALWNVGFLFQWGTGLVPRQGPVDFAQVARNQVDAVPRTLMGLVLRRARR